MQFDSVKDALDHLLSYAGQDGDEAAKYIMGVVDGFTQGGIRIPYESMQIIRAEFTRLREAFAIALQSQKEASADWLDAEFTITGLREKLAAAEHEIEVLNRMVAALASELKCDTICDDAVMSGCGSPECLALLRERAEKELTEQEGASNV